MKSWAILALGGVCLALLGVAVCKRALGPHAPWAYSGPEVRVARVSGPYGHDNLAVFLIHADRQDQRDFLTLDEGLGTGRVEITESEQQQVQKLVIDNRSDQPLYLQEGDRIQGGKQDRIVAASLVIAPHSGKQTLPAFCIEQSRWLAGQGGLRFGVNINNALAPKGARGAAKFEKEQGKVWANVAAVKITAKQELKTANTNSSVNELFDAPQLEEVFKDYTNDLAELLDSHPDAVGVAVVINGQFEEADVYPNHALFRKVCPHLVQSYAVQAALLKEGAKDAPALTADEVFARLQRGEARTERDQQLDARNLLQIRELDDNVYQCTTCYEGRQVNWQVMKKVAAPDVAAPARARRAKLGSEW
jgi:hypothetical protein